MFFLQDMPVLQKIRTAKIIQESMSKSLRGKKSDGQFSKKHMAAAAQCKTTNQKRH